MIHLFLPLFIKRKMIMNDMRSFTTAATFFVLLLAATTATPDPRRFSNAILDIKGLVYETKVWAARTAGRSSILYGMAKSRPEHLNLALSDCERLYGESESRLERLVDGSGIHAREDVNAWLSGVLANHRTCLDGLNEGRDGGGSYVPFASNMTTLISEALAYLSYHNSNDTTDEIKGVASRQRPRPRANAGLLVSWNAATSNADFVVAKDGSGTHGTINQALAAVVRIGSNRAGRVVIYVKSGVYNEKVEIQGNLRNIMFVGDGMDRTIVTGSLNVPDGSTTFSSATFGVSADGFWARDMTFENTAGPQKHQAVALRVNSDRSVFYRCSFKAYQDTLFTHSLRQFYRDCKIYGTIDFIFGDAAVVLQNCDIFVRRPMSHQGNMVTAQGRDDPNSNTGISIDSCRISPARDLESVQGSFKCYLGRPWKRYSRTVVMKTDLDAIIDPKGWTEWRGDYALSTLFYGEYMNMGDGATTRSRVRWGGFHVLRRQEEAEPYSVSRFIQGDSWIPTTGVPFELGV